MAFNGEPVIVPRKENKNVAFEKIKGNFQINLPGVFKGAGPLRRRGSGRHDKAAATRGWSEGFAQRARRCEVSSDTFPSLQKIF